MAITGTYAANSNTSKKNWVVGVDIGATGTYVPVETWVPRFGWDRQEFSTASLLTHGNIKTTITGTRPNVPLEMDFMFDTGPNAPYANFIDILQGASQNCNIKISESSLTTPVSGEWTHEWTSCVITNLDEGDYDQNTDAEESDAIFTAFFEGNLTSVQEP